MERKLEIYAYNGKKKLSSNIYIYMVVCACICV